MLQLLASDMRHIATPLRDLCIGLEALRVLALTQLGGCCLRQTIEHQLHIGHVISQILLAQSLMRFVLAGGHTTPRLGDDIREYRIVTLLSHATTFPLIRQPLAHLNGLDALVDP